MSASTEEKTLHACGAAEASPIKHCAIIKSVGILRFKLQFSFCVYILWAYSYNLLTVLVTVLTQHQDILWNMGHYWELLSLCCLLPLSQSTTVYGIRVNPWPASPPASWFLLLGFSHYLHGPGLQRELPLTMTYLCQSFTGKKLLNRKGPPGITAMLLHYLNNILNAFSVGEKKAKQRQWIRRLLLIYSSKQHKTLKQTENQQNRGCQSGAWEGLRQHPQEGTPNSEHSLKKKSKSPAFLDKKLCSKLCRYSLGFILLYTVEQLPKLEVPSCFHSNWLGSHFLPPLGDR